MIQDQQSRELSQRHVQRRAKRMRVDPDELKLPQLTALDACQVCRLPLSLLLGLHDPAPHDQMQAQNTLMKSHPEVLLHLW